MLLLCPLSDWITQKRQRGRAAGKPITSRIVLAADNWNWLVGIQRGNENSNIVGEQFFGNMKTLLSSLLSRSDIKADYVARIVAILEAKTGIKAPDMPRTKDFNSLSKYGKLLDDCFGTSFMREHPPQVLKRIFKASAEEEDAPAEEEELVEA